MARERISKVKDQSVKSLQKSNKSSGLSEELKVSPKVDSETQLKTTLKQKGKTIRSAPSTSQHQLAPQSNQDSDSSSARSNVLYLGRIPHGFYEFQIKNFLSQFGKVQKVRVSRNKITGRSKHYAFVQMEHPDVARIVASTLNNYLLCGSLLKCHLIPSDRVHEKLFKGAGTRFHVLPWHNIRMQQHNTAVDERLALISGAPLVLPHEIQVSPDTETHPDDSSAVADGEEEQEQEEEILLRKALAIIGPDVSATYKHARSTPFTVQNLERRRSRIEEKMRRRNERMNEILNMEIVG